MDWLEYVRIYMCVRANTYTCVHVCMCACMCASM